MLAPARTNSGERREWCSVPLTAEIGDVPYAGLPKRGPYGEAVDAAAAAAAAACLWAPSLTMLLPL